MRYLAECYACVIITRVSLSPSRLFRSLVTLFAVLVERIWRRTEAKIRAVLCVHITWIARCVSTQFHGSLTGGDERNVQVGVYIYNEKLMEESHIELSSL